MVVSPEKRIAQKRARLAELEARVEARLDEVEADRRAIRRLRKELAAAKEVAPSKAGPAPNRAKKAPVPTRVATKAKGPPASRKKTRRRALAGGPGAMRSLRKAQKRLEELGVKPWKPKAPPKRERAAQETRR